MRFVAVRGIQIACVGRGGRAHDVTEWIIGDDEDRGVGYRRPPKTTRFKKGHSGNPGGCPPGRRREAPYETVLGQTLPIRDEGTERLVTGAEAFVLVLAKLALEGNSAAARECLALIKEARKQQRPSLPDTIIHEIVAPGSVTSALLPLRMAKKLDPYRDTARNALEPWLVEAALARLPHTLSPADQRIIVKATRTPRKVRWPEWWSEYP
jgi:Family of unknown function (DUF5681)